MQGMLRQHAGATFGSEEPALPRATGAGSITMFRLCVRRVRHHVRPVGLPAAAIAAALPFLWVGGLLAIGCGTPKHDAPAFTVPLISGLSPDEVRQRGNDTWYYYFLSERCDVIAARAAASLGVPWRGHAERFGARYTLSNPAPGIEEAHVLVTRGWGIEGERPRSTDVEHHTTVAVMERR